MTITQPARPPLTAVVGRQRFSEFTLYYRGPLKANAGPTEKHAIRVCLHAQLRDLWEHKPLSGMKAKLLDASRSPEVPPGGNNLLFGVGGHQFGCIVSSRLNATAALDITLIRPEAPGSLLAQSGDIDSRLKTLLDALTIPPHPNALPPGFSPTPDQKPFFCLLQDDGLVTSLAVRTHRWLNPDAVSRSEVVLVIPVETEIHTTTFENIDF